MALRRKRRSDLGNLLDILFELTGFIWQIGAGVTAILLFLSYEAYEWAENLNTVGGSSAMLSTAFVSLGWAVYLLPLMLAVLTVLFGAKTFDTYIKEHF